MSVIRESIQILYFLFNPFKKILALYLLAVIALSGLEVFRVSLVYPIINYGLGVDNQPKLLDSFYANLLPVSLDPFIASALLLLLTTLIIVIFYAVVAYGGSYLFALVRDSLDRQIFDKLMNRDYSYFVSKKQGDLLYIGQGAVNEASSAIGNFIEFLKNSLTGLLYLIFIIYLSVWLSIALIILGTIYAFIVKKHLFTRIFRNSSELNIALMEKSVVYQEFISGIKTIFITGSLLFWGDRYNSAIIRLKKAYTNINALLKIPSIINDFILFSIIAIGALLLYYFTEGDFISYIGIFGTYMLALYRLVPAVSTAQTNLSGVVQALPALKLVYNELIHENITKKSRTNICQKFLFENSIVFQNVSFRYQGASKDTIKDLSLEIKKKSSVAIVGDSGSGKTTIANMLGLLYKPTNGGIFIDNINVNDFDLLRVSYPDPR